jgi:hypothetical protein
VSLQTIVRGGLAGRFHVGRELAARPARPTAAVSTRLTISSMRILETSLALSAIATALLIGHGR